MKRWLPIFGALLALVSEARAQEDVVFSVDDFSAHRFYVAPGANNFFVVEGADPGRDLGPTFGATLGYLHRPYVADDLQWYIDCRQGTSTVDCGRSPSPAVQTEMLGPMLTLQLYGAVTLLERIQVGANLPVLLFAEGETFAFVAGTGRDISSVSASSWTRSSGERGQAGGLLDPRISAKIRILDPDSDGNGFTIGTSVFFRIPLAHHMWPGRFLGDPLPQAGGNLIGGFRSEDFRLALNLGVTVREELQNVRSRVGTEFTYGLAAAFRVHPVVELVAEYSGATSFGQRFDSEAPMGLRAAALLHLGSFSMHLGATVGLVYGVGREAFGLFGGMQYAPEPSVDTDRDGLSDDEDGCPGDAEDLDGWDDEDGCPDPDNDGDDILDADDPCPNEAEDLDEHEDEDGCPEPDNDGDGIADGYDSCPMSPEDMDGDRDTDGCPDDDADQDGLSDDVDQCPEEPEDFDGFADEDGCPEEDLDQDGVPDTEDECPEVAEDADGFEDTDGCPEEAGGRPRPLRRGR